MKKYLVLTSEIKIAKNNSKYASMGLYTEDGENINGMLWNYKFEDAPPTNVVVEIIGNESEFNGKKQISITKITRTKDDPTKYAPQSSMSEDVIMSRFLSIIDRISTDDLKNALLTIVNEDKFKYCPSAINHHHHYLRGNSEHISEVCEISINLAQIMIDLGREIDFDVLITSAILHDIGKTLTYKLEGVSPKVSDIEKLVGHIQLAQKYIDELPLSEDTKYKIKHCILAHHGRIEWGSPITPLTIEADILHQADYLSSRGYETYNWEV